MSDDMILSAQFCKIFDSMILVGTMRCSNDMLFLFFSEQSYRTLKSIGFQKKLMEEGGRDHCIRRNTLKFDGTLTQYSETEILWIFPVNFDLLTLLFRNERAEVMKKTSETFQPGILHPCSFKFRCCTCCNQLVLRDLDIIF